MEKNFANNMKTIQSNIQLLEKGFEELYKKDPSLNVSRQ